MAAGRGRGPSPRDDAQRRRGDDWDEAPRGRRAPAHEPAPWLDEADYDDEDGPVHTLIGRRMLLALLALLGILAVGVVVGILLVSGREDSPIDVPGVGEAVPVLSAPGPWKLPPSGPDTEGVPVEGQGQVLFGTGDGRETDARIALDALPEDPLLPPGVRVEEGVPVDDRIPDTAIAQQAPAQGTASQPMAAPPVQQAPARPKPVETVVPREAQTRPASPKVIYAPEPAPGAAAASGGGQTLQLGAFSSESRARTAFKDLSGRYAYLQGMEPQIVPVSSEGKTLYRLRTAAASPAAAREICGRLRVAGEACSVVGN